MLAQSERIGIAEAELYPHISLTGSIQWQAEDIDDLFDTSSAFALISPGFTWNILNYGRLVNGVDLQRQRFRESVYDYQQSVLTAQQEVEDAMIGFLKAQDRAEKLADAVAQVNEAENIALTLYDTGGIDFNRVFVIQAFQFAQQDDWVVSRASVALNLIRIYRALGGGWQIRCPGGDGGVPLAAFDEQADGGMIGALPTWDERQIDAEVPEPVKQPSNAPAVVELPSPTKPDVDKPDTPMKERLEKSATDEKNRTAEPLPPVSDTDRRLRELLEQSDRDQDGQPDSESQRLKELLEGEPEDPLPSDRLQELLNPAEPN